MSQVITAKLKLKLTTEQKALLSQTALAYRDALNYTSQVAFDGYNKHLDLIANGAHIGAAKIVYQRSSKIYYLMVSVEVETPKIDPLKITRISGVDVGMRYLAVETDLQNKSKFYSGKNARHKANRYHKARMNLQRKDTRSAKRRLIALSGRERRFIADVNHQISKDIAKPNALIGLENLTGIRDRTRTKSGQKASKKRRRANRNKAKWSYAELHGYIDYKANLNGSLATKVPAHYTSKSCPKPKSCSCFRNCGGVQIQAHISGGTPLDAG